METMLRKLDKAREILMNRNIICLTMDVDWASEYAIQQSLKIFEERQLPLTVFVTHKSRTIAEALVQKKIKCGIHPNFMPDSSQGASYQEVVDFCFNLLPDARICRGHRYYEVNDTVELLSKRGIVCESNICTLMDVVPPFLHRSKNVSFPIFWEDGAFLYQYKGFDRTFFRERFLRPGLKVINMHPMHLMLNTPYFSYTREIKDRLTRNEWNNLDKSVIDELAFKGDGIRNFIEQMLEDIKKEQLETAYLEDIYDWICSL